MGILKSDGTGKRLDGSLADANQSFDGTVGDEEIRDALHGAIDKFFDRIAGKDKQQGAAAALGGTNDSAGIASGEAQIQTLPDMMRALNDVDELAWGRYILSTDMLRDKIDPSQRDTLIEGAVACGREWADRVVAQYGNNKPSEIAEKLGVHVGSNTAPMSGRRALFAQYVPGGSDSSTQADRIDLMADPLNRYAELHDQLVAGDPANADILPSPARVRTLLLAHELFHVIEDRNEATIYTRTTTISLWKVFGKENRSTVRALGEVGAGAFAQALVGSSFCPFALDIVLMWSYDPATSRALYDTVNHYQA